MTSDRRYSVLVLLALAFNCFVDARGLRSPVVVAPSNPSGLLNFTLALLGEGVTAQQQPLYVGGPSVFVVHGDLVLQLGASISSSVADVEISVLVDGRDVYAIDGAFCQKSTSGKLRTARATASIGGLSRGHHIVAAYVKVGDGIAAAFGGPLTVWTEPAAALTPPLESASTAIAGRKLAVARPWVGSYYSTIQVPDVSYAMNYSAFLGRPDGSILSVEEMLRSQGDLGFVDVVHRWAANVSTPLYNGLTAVGWQQSTPSLPAWYPYRKRDNETYGILPDSPRIPESLATHAAELLTAGVDYVLGDGTNLVGWPPTDPQAQADVRQMRPFEVVMEEWAALRANNVSTPQFGVWGRANDGDGSIWVEYLNRLYNNATYISLNLLPTPLSPPNATNKRLFMIAAPDRTKVNFSLIEEINANYGRDDVTSMLTWVQNQGGDYPDPSYWEEGMWGFESPCSTLNSTGMPQFTNRIRPEQRCNHSMTTNSGLGNSWCVSHGLGWNNIPFVAPGKRSGLYLQKQFEDIFAFQASGGTVDNVFTPSFNEYSIGALNFTSFFGLNNPYLGSMGGGDPRGGSARGADIEPDARGMFVDGFGDGRARAWEPTVYDQGAALELYASCVRVMTLNALWAPGSTSPSSSVGGVAVSPPCTIAGEVCCMYHAEQFVSPTWSLEAHDTVSGAVLDAMVTSDADEVARLLSGAASSPSSSPSSGAVEWVQVCAPWAGSPGYLLPLANPPLCSNPQVSSGVDYSAVRGPFLAWDNTTTSANITNATALYRCANTTSDGTTNATRHLISIDGRCEGLGVVVDIIGYIATWRTSEMPRSLRRCFNPAAGPSLRTSTVSVSAQPTGVWYHAVDGPCAPADSDQGLLGFVSA